MSSFHEQLNSQRFANDYELVDGLVLHAEHGENFQIPPHVIKKYVSSGFFVEVRIDSPRFSVATEVGQGEQCKCPSCQGEMSKPILRHLHPVSLDFPPEQHMPSRGWGEDFWIRIVERSGGYFRGVVDNHLAESRLHGLNLGSQIFLSEDHILAVHDIHRRELLSAMNIDDLRQLAQWLSRKVERNGN